MKTPQKKNISSQTLLKTLFFITLTLIFMVACSPKDPPENEDTQQEVEEEYKDVDKSNPITTKELENVQTLIQEELSDLEEYENTYLEDVIVKVNKVNKTEDNITYQSTVVDETLKEEVNLSLVQYTSITDILKGDYLIISGVMKINKGDKEDNSILPQVDILTLTKTNYAEVYDPTVDSARLDITQDADKSGISIKVTELEVGEQFTRIYYEVDRKEFKDDLALQGVIRMNGINIHETKEEFKQGLQDYLLETSSSEQVFVFDNIENVEPYSFVIVDSSVKERLPAVIEYKITQELLDYLEPQVEEKDTEQKEDKTEEQTEGKSSEG